MKQSALQTSKHLKYCNQTIRACHNLKRQLVIARSHNVLSYTVIVSHQAWVAHPIAIVRIAKTKKVTKKEN